MDMLHKRLVFPRIQHFSISAAGMSRSQKGSSSLETELLPKRYPRSVANCGDPSFDIIGSCLFRHQWSGKWDSFPSGREAVVPWKKILDQFIASGRLYIMSVPGATK
jgi:hypothetical protein